MKYNDNGEWKDIIVKATDTLPIGTEVDYNGTDVPDGWEEVEDTPTQFVMWESNADSMEAEYLINLSTDDYDYLEIIYAYETKVPGNWNRLGSTGKVFNWKSDFPIQLGGCVHTLSTTATTTVPYYFGRVIYFQNKKTLKAGKGAHFNGAWYDRASSGVPIKVIGYKL